MGFYCLSPRAKAINPMRPEGAWYNYLKPYYNNASVLLHPTSGQCTIALTSSIRNHSMQL